MNKKILEGIRIVEFGWAVVGPLTTSWAGGYGAEVIKIETKTRPDVIRTMTPYKDDRVNLNNSLFFGRENANKYSLGLNLKHPEGVKIAQRLIAESDCVLDSYTSGVMASYGLGYDDLKRVKPDIIMLSSCMYGQTGALRSMPGYGVPLTAISGLTALCGWPDRPPTGPYGSYTDYLVPRFNLLAMVSALDYRRRTGKGIYIDAAQLESSVQFVSPALLEYDANQQTSIRCGNAARHAAPHGVFRCKGDDRWCAISIFTEEEWQGFCAAVGHLPWTEKPEFVSLAERKSHEAELNRLVEEWTREKEDKWVMAQMQSHAVPAGIANNGQNLGNDPHLTFNNYYRRLEHPEMGSVDYAPHSIEFSKSPQEIFRSPCLGEHTEHICKNIIGLSDEEFQRYAAEGIFE